LPTTPFLILSAVCFNRGSKKFHSWLLNHKILGPPILDWQQQHVIRTRYKVLALTMLFLSLSFILTKETIPNAGKIAFTLFVIPISLFIGTRKSNRST
jgi:uncharacterized membrane protein YbaN (DUF454 family)